MEKTTLFGRFLLILVLPQFTLPSSIPSLTEGIKVKAVPPVYSIEIKDVTLYEATIPIFFHIQLPKIPEEFDSEKEHLLNHNCSAYVKTNDEDVTAEYSHYHCALERQFILASRHIVKDLQLQREQFFSKEKENLTEISANENSTTEEDYSSENFYTAPAARKRRQAAPIIAAGSLLAGFLLRPAVSKFTGNLFGSNDEWASHFNSLRESLIREHELLLDFEHSTQVYTKEMSDIITTMSGLLTEQRRDLVGTLRLLATKMHADMIQEAIQSCKTKHLPGNLIQPKFLQKTLSILNQNLTDSLNYTLAISSTDMELGKYYKLPIADCLFTEDKAHITLNVPLRRKDVRWKLHEIIHTKYAFYNQICEVYPQEAAYLAEEIGTGTRSILITNHMLRYCSVYEDQLCMVPQFGKDSVQSLKCTSLAATSGVRGRHQRAEALLKSCSFRCYPSDEVVITQVNDKKIVVTNAHNLTYQCADNAEKTIKVGRLGAVEIDLECHCSIKINGGEMLPKPFPCAYTSKERNQSGHEMFTFTVPFVWAHNLTQILENDDSSTIIEDHEKLGDHVNLEWFKLIPVLNFTKSQEEKEFNFTIPEKADESKYASVLTSVEIWLGLLSLIVFIHVGLTFYCGFKMFMARLGEYELPPVNKRPREREDNFGGWVFTRKHLSSSSGHHNNHKSQSSSSLKSGSSGNSNRRHNFEVYQASSIEACEDKGISQDRHSYQSNQTSVLNKLI